MPLTTEQLHRYLGDEKWHSGQELADSLGVSRTIVWKQIEKLRSKGIEVEASSGKGYRLKKSQTGLYIESFIREHLNPVVLSKIGQIIVANSIGSTNDECLKLVNEVGQSEGAEAGDILVLAEQQTNGRGRRGKQWHSPYASSLYMSISQRFNQGASALSGLSLIVGIAVANVLAHAGLQDVQLKWPNDILFDGKKLGGILLELTGDIAGPCYAVIGIGLNLQMPPDAAKIIDQPFTDLVSAGPTINWDKNRLAAQIVNELDEQIEYFRRAGFGPFQERWTERDSFMGQEVVVSSSASQIDAGKHVGVNAEGSILLETANGVKPYSGGEISLRSRG